MFGIRKSSQKKGSFENIIKYNLSTLLNDEAKFNIDLNKDNNIGDVVDKIIANTDEFGIYKTTSGAFIKDESSLSVGDSSVSPTLLTQQVTLRGQDDDQFI